MKIIEEPELPKEFFKVEVAPQLIAQSVRVYLANQRQGNQSALTRAEISRTRKKLYKQKGTGGARHGDRKAPIFVGGGVTFAPKPRDYSLKFPKVMKDKALYGALSMAVKEKKLEVVAGLDKLTGKTKEFAQFLGDHKKVLIITDDYRLNIWQAGKNIQNVTILPFNQINVYEIIKAAKIIIMEEVITVIASGAKQSTVIKKQIATSPSAPRNDKVKAKKVLKKKT